MEQLKYCKICLATDVKMYSMEIPWIGAAFLRLVQMPVPDINKHHTCYECVSLLHKYEEFRLKCMKACTIITSLKEQNGKNITKQDIQNVNRKSYKLESKLSLTPISTLNLTNHCSEYEEIFNFNDVKANLNFEIKIEEDFVESDIKDETNSNDGTDQCILDHDYHSAGELNIPEYKHLLIDDTKVAQDEEKECMNNVNIKEEQNEIIIESKNTPTEKRNFNNTITSSKPQKQLKRQGIEYDYSYFEGYATVVFLTHEQAVKEVMLRKESKNYVECPYKCELCYKGFDMLTTLENHMKKHSLESGKYKCVYCHLRYLKPNMLRNHRLKCHTRKFYCKLCPYVCFCIDQAKSHVRLHKGKQYPCSDCGKIFRLQNSLLMHKHLRHVKPCVCDFCGGVFGTPRGLRTHKILAHRQLQEKNKHQGPKCEECDVHFATETAWKRHLVLSTKHHVSNGCEHCGESFVDEEALKSHKKVHARKQFRKYNVQFPFTCKMCDRLLTNRDEYNDHMTSHHPDSKETKKICVELQSRHVCEFCGKEFKKPLILKYHRRAHTGERPHKCKECGKCFGVPSVLYDHQRRCHQPKKTYKCQQCDKQYASKNALDRHVKSHAGKRPHKCTRCDKSFLFPCQLKEHTKYVHEKVPWPKRDRSKRAGNKTRADTTT